MYTMSTTVRIREDDKQALDRLQAKITLETGERPSLEEVLHRVVALAEAREDELIVDDEPPELSEEEKQRVLEATHDLGFTTREEDVDEVLYGGAEEGA
jgi:hypothetical protein